MHTEIIEKAFLVIIISFFFFFCSLFGDVCIAVRRCIFSVARLCSITFSSSLFVDVERKNKKLNVVVYRICQVKEEHRLTSLIIERKEKKVSLIIKQNKMPMIKILFLLENKDESMNELCPRKSSRKTKSNVFSLSLQSI